MPTLATNHRTVEEFARLFRGRDDIYGTFVPVASGADEKYEAKHEALTAEQYRRHLDGEGTLGVYPLLDDGSCYWSCLDFDAQDIEPARACQKVLAEHGIRSYVETSKRKGFHLWLFWKDTAPAHHVRQVMKKVLQLAGAEPATEIFPKQDQLVLTGGPGRYGNMVNLPYPGDAPRGKRVMLDAAFVEMTVEEFLLSVVRNDPQLLTRIVPRPRPPQDLRVRVITVDSPTPPSTRADPPCIRAMLNTTCPEGERHNWGMRLSQFWLHSRKLDEDQARAELEDWNERCCDPPMRAGDLRDCLAVTSDPSCTWLRQVPLCAEVCTWTACDWSRKDDLEKQEIIKGSVRALSLEAREAAQSWMPEQRDDDERHRVERFCQVPFIGAYVAAQRTTTDAPALFHCLAALAAISAAVGNNIYCNHFGGDTLRPHLWLGLIAPSGMERKSTVINGCRRLVGQFAGMSERLMGSDSTPEPMQEELAVRPYGLMTVDELGALMKDIKEKQYMKGMEGLLTQLWESPLFTRNRKGSGKVTIENAALTMLGASTRDWLQDNLKQSDFRTGFLVRFLFVPAYVNEPWVSANVATRPDYAAMESLAECLTRFAEYSGPVSFARVTDIIDEWDKGFKLKFKSFSRTGQYDGLGSRAQSYAKKFAMLFQVGASLHDVNGKSTWGYIEPWVMELAIETVEWVFRRQIEMFTRDFAFSKEGRNRQILLDFIRDQGGQVNHAKVSRDTSLQGKELKDAVAAAQEAGYIKIFQQTTDKGGRPATYYQLVHLRLVGWDDQPREDDDATQAPESA